MTTLVTLIPAYRPTYLGEVLAALAAQTWRDFRVVVSDDSPNGEVSRWLRAGGSRAATRALDVTLVQGPRRGAMHNLNALLRGGAAGARLVHLMMDDDLLTARFYERHVAAHDAAIGEAVTASVSRRVLVDDRSQVLGEFPVPAAIRARAATLPSNPPLTFDFATLAATTIPACDNWLGELSHAVFTRDAAMQLLHSTLGRLSTYGLGDIGLLLQAAQRGRVAWIDEHLGGFRQHATSSTSARRSFGHRCGYLAWAALALDAWSLGAIDARGAATAIAHVVRQCLLHYPDDALMAGFVGLVEHNGSDLATLYSRFEVYWHAALARDDQGAATLETAPARAAAAAAIAA